jgi:hypothetical protein
MSTTSASSVPALASAHPLQQLKAECEELARTRPGDTHKMASLHQQMSLNYYQDVRRQAQQSFYSALVAAIVGTLFFLYAAWYMLPRDGSTSSNAYISLIAGALVQVISAINFYLYSKTAHQFSGFHVCLERTNRYLLVNTLCENLSDEHKDDMRMEIIRVIANAPMLTSDVINGIAQQRNFVGASDTNVPNDLTHTEA